jgi:hypothetical protein
MVKSFIRKIYKLWDWEALSNNPKHHGRDLKTIFYGMVGIF